MVKASPPHIMRAPPFATPLDGLAVGGKKRAMTPRFFRRSRSTAGSARTERRESLRSLLRFFLTRAVISWAFPSPVGAPFNISSGSKLAPLSLRDYLAGGEKAPQSLRPSLSLQR